MVPFNEGISYMSFGQPCGDKLCKFFLIGWSFHSLTKLFRSFSNKFPKAYPKVYLKNLMYELANHLTTNYL